MGDEVPDRLAVRADELAAMLGVGVRTIRQWAASGDLPCVRMLAPGARRPLLLFRVDAVRQWLAEREGVNGER